MLESRTLAIVGLVAAGFGSLCGCANNAGEAICKNGSISGNEQAVVQTDESVAQPITPVDQRELEIWIYQDKNGNGKCEIDTEIIGEVNGPVNLNEFGLAVYLAKTVSSKILYSSWDSNGNLLGEGRMDGSRLFSTETNLLTGDFLDELNGSPDGEYKISALNRGDTFSKKITIHRDNPLFTPK